MILYCFLLLLTGVVTGLALGWVSGKPGNAVKNSAAASHIHSDVMIYRGQMAEIEIEKKQGLLDESSAEEARLELARRMLEAERKTSSPAAGGKRTRAFRLLLSLAVLFIPLFSWSVYMLTGSPDMPSHPFSMLMARDPATLDDAEKLARMEVLANRSPENGHLADELAGLYLAAGRFQDAVNAYNRAIALNGENAGRLLGYATALTGFEGGVVSRDAENAFREAARLDPQNPDAQIFLARGLLQNGKKTEAVKLLEDFLQTVPDNKPWRKDLADAVADLKKNAAAEPQGAAVSPEQRRFIAANIDRLTARLAAAPDDLQGWMMLINAFLVLERKDAAKTALQKGLDALPADKARRLAGFAQERGLVRGGGRTEKQTGETTEKTTEKTVE